MIRLVLQLTSSLDKVITDLNSEFDDTIAVQSVFDDQYDIRSEIDTELNCTSNFDIELTHVEE